MGWSPEERKEVPANHVSMMGLAGAGRGIGEGPPQEDRRAQHGGT